ncbi:type II toxin-antitoxin system RelB/DinJ family antitoxin [Streptococcus sp. zg-JUN1979]|uniref:type II toxin-antitoxin system RelB/DinJ family antitoxin n=1 Tax=Streptococcus sp. zg-JUN1979 TaxID=3391450 RepID=UPI0039A5AA26
MATKLFQKRVDEDLLERVNDIYKSLGTSVGDAFVMFLRKSEEVRGLPFELRQPQDVVQAIKEIGDIAEKNARHLDMSNSKDVAFLFDEEY